MISESQHYIRNLIKFKKYTPKGLLYLEEWGSLRLAANTAYLEPFRKRLFDLL